MSDELKACPIPWCGCPAETRDIQHYQIVDEFVRCTDVGCELHDSWTKIEVWNRRSPSPAVRALVEAFGPLMDLIPRDGPKPEAVRAAQAALAAVEREIGGA